MARLNTYATDGAPDASDKVIGSDSTGTITKNYPLGNIATWLKSSGATAVLGQNNFTFQTVADPRVGRLPGTFSLPVIGGDGTPFDAVTALKFSQQSDTGQNIADFIASTVGSRVILGQLDNLNAFGVYLLESFTQDSAAPTFYDAVLTFVGGNGTLIGGSPYGMATYSSTQTDGGAWGSITGTVTDQTDLVTYVTSERLNYPVQSPNGTSFIIVAGNDGTLAAIPPDSTAPSITSVPTISGTLNVAETLTVVAGTVTGIPAPTTAFQWQRSDNGTTGWADIAGATDPSYLLDDADAGKYIRVKQTEENALGAATENSLATSIIGQTLFFGVLDIHPGAAAGFSLRRLTRLYEGPLIRVRRKVDNASADIGYDVLGNLDTAALNSFCNPGGVPTDAKLEIWYNQVAIGDDATQSTDTKQLTIVENGFVVGLNGKPAMYPPVGNIQSANTLPFSIQYSGSPDLSSFLVSQISYANTFILTPDDNINTPDGIIMWTRFGGVGAYRSGGGHSSNTFTQHLSASLFNLNGYGGYIDGNLVRTDTTSSMNDDWNFNFINIYSGVTDSDDKIQEVILYLADKSNQREAIENTINEYYQIY